LLDDFIPGPQLVELDHVDVAAPPERAYQAMHDLDLARSPVLRVVLRMARRLGAYIHTNSRSEPPGGPLAL